MLLTIGYMVARGIAKSGSRDYYDARRKSAGSGLSPARENTAAAARPGPSLVACGQSDGGPVHRTGSDPNRPREVR